MITFGRFRVLDLGDLLWNNEHDLVCPRNMIGTVDLYMVTHHGLATSGSPQLVHTVRPRVAVMQNGTRKGGAPLAFQILRASPGLEDVWTLHWSYAGGIEHNSAGGFIANVDSASAIASILTAAPGQGGARQRGAFTGALHQDLGAGGRDVHGDEHAERVCEDVCEAVMRGCGAPAVLSVGLYRALGRERSPLLVALALTRCEPRAARESLATRRGSSVAERSRPCDARGQ